MIPITIHDHIADDFGTIIITESELAAMCSLWNRNDPLLGRLQARSEFTGCTRWGDLDTRHLQILLTLHVGAGLSDPLVNKGLRLVLAAFCVRLQDNIDGDLNQVTIHRFEAEEVHIDFAASIAVHRVPPRRARFKLAVDNQP